MRQAAQGDDVKVHYTGKLSNGETFDSSRDGEPMDVRIGAGRLIEDFEKALLGMAEGDVKEVTIAPEDAYGLRQDALVHTVAREQLPPDLDLAVGMQLEARDPNGGAVRFRLIAFDEDKAVLDANHPLAGETLNFEIEMVDIAA